MASIASLDCIHIKGIRAYGYVGFLPEEQVLGQWFEVDLVLWLDLTAASQSDDLTQTYDYSVDVPKIQHLIQTVRYSLLEKLADEIAAIALTSPRIEQVQVRLIKPNPPIPDFNGQIVVEITRSR